MSHTPSRHKVDKWNAEQRARREVETAAAAERAAARARRIVNAWNARARSGQPAEFFPTFGTALAGGAFRLVHMCPACRQVSELDLRTVADHHHRRAPISVLIPELSCRACCPNPPFAVLLGLETGARKDRAGRDV